MLGLARGSAERRRGELAGARVSSGALQRERGESAGGGERMRMRGERARGPPGRLLVQEGVEQEVAAPASLRKARSCLRG